MKKSELRQLIREEISKVLKEAQDRYRSDMEDGLYIAINKKPNKLKQEEIKLAAEKRGLAYPEKIRFEVNKATGQYSVFIPNAGDDAMMLDVLKKFGIRQPPYTSPHLR